MRKRPTRSKKKKVEYTAVPITDPAIIAAFEKLYKLDREGRLNGKVPESIRRAIFGKR